MILTELHTNELKGVLAIYDNYVSYHKYNKELSNGEPLTEQTCKELFNFLFEENFANSYSFDNIIPNNILKFHQNKKCIVWYTKPTKKYLQFISNLPIEDAIYPLPYLIWKLEEDNLNVFATIKTPSQTNTTLFHAPFLNVNEQGEICMGNSKFTTKSNNYQEIIKQAEKGFFTSLFSHTNHDNILAKKQNVVNMYQEQQGNPNKPFDTELLNPINKTLKDICND